MRVDPQPAAGGESRGMGGLPELTPRSLGYPRRAPGTAGLSQRGFWARICSYAPGVRFWAWRRDWNKWPSTGEDAGTPTQIPPEFLSIPVRPLTGWRGPPGCQSVPSFPLHEAWDVPDLQAQHGSQVGKHKGWRQQRSFWRCSDDF